MDFPHQTLTQLPSVHPSAFIAQGAVVVGDVRISQQASVWFNAVLRGDINYISIGACTNIQDGCLIHLENDLPCTVGQYVTVGHGAILHACSIESECLIGMGAIILNGAIIGRGSTIAAGAVVKENMIVPPCSMVAGVPGKIVKSLPESAFETNRKWAEKYIKLAQLHAQSSHMIYRGALPPCKN